MVDFHVVRPVFSRLESMAMADGTTMRSLASAAEREPRAAALRIWKITGIVIEDTSMPKAVDDMFAWAHYGISGKGTYPVDGDSTKGMGKGKRKPAMRRSDHLALLMSEFGGEDAAHSGIQGTMRRELVAVEAAVKTKLALNGGISEIDRLPFIPHDMLGQTEKQALVSCPRGRGDFEVTALMWATRHGVRWVKSMLSLRADPLEVTPAGWTPLLYASIFEARGIVMDGQSDSGEAYGSYRNRSKGVVGPLLEAVATLSPTLSLKEFCRACAPTPVSKPLVGPVDIARGEAGATAAWAAAVIGHRAIAPS